MDRTIYPNCTMNLTFGSEVSTNSATNNVNQAVEKLPRKSIVKYPNRVSVQDYDVTQREHVVMDITGQTDVSFGSSVQDGSMNFSVIDETIAQNSNTTSTYFKSREIRRSRVSFAETHGILKVRTDKVDNTIYPNSTMNCTSICNATGNEENMPDMGSMRVEVKRRTRVSFADLPCTPQSRPAMMDLTKGHDIIVCSSSIVESKNFTAVEENGSEVEKDVSIPVDGVVQRLSCMSFANNAFINELNTANSDLTKPDATFIDHHLSGVDEVMGTSKDKCPLTLIETTEERQINELQKSLIPKAPVHELYQPPFQRHQIREDRVCKIAYENHTRAETVSLLMKLPYSKRPTTGFGKFGSVKTPYAPKKKLIPSARLNVNAATRSVEQQTSILVGKNDAGTSTQSFAIHTKEVVQPSPADVMIKKRRLTYVIRSGTENLQNSEAVSVDPITLESGIAEVEPLDIENGSLSNPPTIFIPEIVALESPSPKFPALMMFANQELKESLDSRIAGLSLIVPEFGKNNSTKSKSGDIPLTVDPIEVEAKIKENHEPTIESIPAIVQTLENTVVVKPPIETGNITFNVAVVQEASITGTPVQKPGDESSRIIVSRAIGNTTLWSVPGFVTEISTPTSMLTDSRVISFESTNVVSTKISTQPRIPTSSYIAPESLNVGHKPSGYTNSVPETLRSIPEDTFCHGLSAMTFIRDSQPDLTLKTQAPLSSIGPETQAYLLDWTNRGRTKVAQLIKVEKELLTLQKESLDTFFAIHGSKFPVDWPQFITAKLKLENWFAVPINERFQNFPTLP